MKRLIFVLSIFASFVFAQVQMQEFVDQFDVHLQCDKYEKRLFGLGREEWITNKVVLGLTKNNKEEYDRDVLQKYSTAVLNDVESPYGEIKKITVTIDSITAYQVDINRKTLSGTFAGRNLKCKKVSKQGYQRVLNSILDDYSAKFKDNKI